MNRSIIQRAEKCPDCTAIGKNLKPIKSHSDWKEIPDPTEPNQEVQLDFAGPFCNGKNAKTYLLVAVDKFSKFPSVFITKSTNAGKVIKFLEGYTSLHGTPKLIKTDQFSSFKSKELENYCKSNNIEQAFCPVDDHRANGAVERCIQSIKRRLGAMLRNKNNNMEAAINEILDSIRKSKHAKTKKSPH